MSGSCVDAGNAAVQGSSIPIAVVTMEVLGGTTPGIHDDALSLTVLSMLNFGNNYVVDNITALIVSFHLEKTSDQI